MSRPILYSFWRSSCSWRVRAALNLKKIEYDIKPISIITASEQNSEEYRQINPNQKVPSLVIDGHTLIESLPIMYYLEETRQQHPLLPADAINRTRVREICEVIASGIQPLQNVGTLKRIEKEKRKDWTHYWISQGFLAVETLLKSSAGRYSFGDAVTLADCCLVPQVYNARLYQVDLKAYPTILRIENELLSHPAFKASHPKNQPDTPKDERGHS